MKQPLLAALFVSIAIFAGCTTGTHYSTAAPRPAISPNLVRLYEVAPTNSQFLGIVEANCKSGFTAISWDCQIDEMKKQAAEIGANGITIQKKELVILKGAIATGTAFFVP